ncbi:hypothetical protein RvY_06280 [Ramazzottius varieornatus]|uniref:Uncharacterized protein n=1 Tax=Ramazzottius varieornatus TaxID=947166 RepID=A0A1D1UY04_RAMVA|nr:hypothetical protein RvY_06280 [Ramazzottius varieornatus]
MMDTGIVDPNRVVLRLFLLCTEVTDKLRHFSISSEAFRRLHDSLETFPKASSTSATEE